MSQTLSTESTGLGFHVLAPQSRRFACNRCRAQKLRCIHKSPDSTVCARCERAKTECIYTPSKRATKRKDDTSDNKIKKREKSAEYSPKDSSDLSRRSTNLSTASSTESPIHRDQSYSGMIAQMDDSLGFPPPFNDTSLDLFGVDSMGLQHPNASFTANPNFFDLNSTLPATHEPSFDLNMMDTSTDSPFHMEQPFHPFSELTPAPSTSVFPQNPVGNVRQQNSQPLTFNPGEDPMEGVLTRLSSLNVSLYKLLGLCDPDDNVGGFNRSRNGQQSQERDTVSDILRSSQQFIDILDWLAQSLPSRSSSNSPPASSRSSSVDSGYTSIKYERKSNAGINASSSTPLLDMQTTYLIIACYIRILRLYSTLFSRILRFLDDSNNNCNSTDSDGKSSPLLFNFAAVQLGGVDLQNHGKLQIQILVQSSLYMLDTIEGKLGVSDFASKHNDLSPSSITNLYTHQRKGILSSAAAMTALDIAIRQDDLESQEMGKRKIGSLREDVSRVNNMLQTA